MNSCRNLNWRGLAAILSVAFLFVSAVACGKKSRGPEQQAAADAQAPAPSTPLDIELAKLTADTFERNPEKRPLVVSDKMPSRFDWGTNTLLKGYAATGRRSAKWDRDAVAAFEAYTKYRLGERDAWYAIGAAVTNAIRAGCDDPMMRYLQARYEFGVAEQSKADYAVACLKAHEGLLSSQYHPFYKQIAAQRACEAARNADRDGHRAARIHLATMSLEDMARDPNVPVEEMFNQAASWIRYNNAKGWTDAIMEYTEPLLKRNWGSEERYFRLRGLMEERRAWEERGGGFVDTVTEEGWRGFAEHLQKAEKFLTQAWEMNTNSYETAFLMMRLELGQSKGLPVMQKWFRRAMALDPNSYEAASLMGFYLEPRWHGSTDQESLKFGRSCVESTNWAGTVPLVLADLHHSLAKYYKLGDTAAYWHRPHVWPDIRASYEKYFKLYPEDYSWRHNYARDAYLCGKYDEFLAQAKLFGGSTNFPWFGGKEKWDAMLAEAAAKRKKP